MLLLLLLHLIGTAGETLGLTGLSDSLVEEWKRLDSVPEASIRTVVIVQVLVTLEDLMHAEWWCLSAKNCGRLLPTNQLFCQTDQ